MEAHKKYLFVSMLCFVVFGFSGCDKIKGYFNFGSEKEEVSAQVDGSTSK